MSISDNSPIRFSAVENLALSQSNDPKKECSSLHAELVTNKLATQLLSNSQNMEEALKRATLLIKKISSNSDPQQTIEKALLIDSSVRAILQHCKDDYEKALEKIYSDEFKHIQTDFREALEVYPQTTTPSDEPTIYCIHKDQQLGKGHASKAKVCENLQTHKKYCRLGMRLEKTPIMERRILDFFKEQHKGLLQIIDISPGFIGKKGKLKRAFIVEKYDGSLKKLISSQSESSSTNVSGSQSESSSEASQNPLNLTPEQKIKITIDLLEGLKALHEAGIAHNDLKPENVLIRFNQETQEYEAVIGDIDMASDIHEDVHRGTPHYWAPEMVLHYDQTLNLAAKDVYEMGEVLLALWQTELEDYNISSLIDINESFQTSDPTERQPVFKVLTPQNYERCKPLSNDPPFVHFLYSIMQFKPENRLSAEEALKQFTAMTAKGTII